MRSRIKMATFVIIGSVLFCALGMIALINRNAPPSVWQNPPVYADAQHVRVEEFGEYGKLETRTAQADAVHIVKVITFTVADNESSIISFYQKAFSNGGMEPTTWGREIQEPKALNYSWTSSGRSPSLYFIDLITKPIGSDQTNVEIGVSKFPGR